MRYTGCVFRLSDPEIFSGSDFDYRPSDSRPAMPGPGRHRRQTVRVQARTTTAARRYLHAPQAAERASVSDSESESGVPDGWHDHFASHGVIR